MALSRRAGRREDPPIWSGFVDSLATLLLVLMFVLTIFTIVQSVLRDTIDTQDVELDGLTAQVAQLADALGLEQARAEDLAAEVGRLSGALDTARAEGAQQAQQIATLQATLTAREADLTAAQGRIASFEAQVASLLGERDAARGEAGRLAATLAEAEAARKVITEKDAALIDAAQKVALLNQQVAELRGQLGALQALLDQAQARDVEARVQIETLGSRLNSALAQVAAEERRRAEMEEAERRKLEAENQDLSRFRSEFFGELSRVLAGREGVRVVGDRFVFSSEVLFPPGSADLSPAGQQQIAGVTAILRDIAGQIPPGIDWVIRVDGHTDNVPLSGQGQFRDNWALSQARALSVVRYMQDVLGFPPARMAATGFGEWQPVATGDGEAARAQNRRIELKLTER